MPVGLAVLVLAGAAAWFLVLGPPPAPGFIRDGASISYNAYTISQNLHNQNGGVLPLYLKSFGDYKSPFFVYVLAAVFRVTGPTLRAGRLFGPCRSHSRSPPSHTHTPPVA